MDEEALLGARTHQEPTGGLSRTAAPLVPRRPPLPVPAARTHLGQGTRLIRRWNSAPTRRNRNRKRVAVPGAAQLHGRGGPGGGALVCCLGHVRADVWTGLFRRSWWRTEPCLNRPGLATPTTPNTTWVGDTPPSVRHSGHISPQRMRKS